MAIEHLHTSFCHGNGAVAILIHSLNRFSLCTKMAAVAVAKLLLCCDMQRGESVTRWEASSVVSFKPEMGFSVNDIHG